MLPFPRPRPNQPRRRGNALSLVVVLGLFAGAGYLLLQQDGSAPPLSGTARVSDGDSFRLGDERIRLVGLDAPELDQICWRKGGEAWPCGRAARDRLAQLLIGAALTCRPEGHDRYGRTLARCSNGAAGDLAAAMVRDGLAVADIEYAGEELAARRAGIGLWSGRFDAPKVWRDEGPSDAPRGGMWDWLTAWLHG